MGEVYDGTVRSVMPYGLFVEFLPGKDGLLHISEIDWKRYETIEETGYKEGDKIQVKLIDIDAKTGKFKLSRRALSEKPEGYEERPARPPRQERPERGERFERGDRGDRGDRFERGDRGDRGDRQERGRRPFGGDRRNRRNNEDRNYNEEN